MKITVFGLGEAGSLISADLAAAGINVVGYDPAAVENLRQTPQQGLPEIPVLQD